MLRGCVNGPFPQRLVGGLGADLQLLFFRLLALIAVDRQEAVEKRLGRRALGQELGHLRLEKGLAQCDRVLGEGARLELDRQATGGGVARLVARRHRQRRAVDEIVGQRDQRDARAAVGRAVGKAREDSRPDVHVHAGGVGRAERDQHGAAGRDVARGGQQLQPRRREVDRHRHRGQGAVAGAKRAPEVVSAPHLDRRRTFLQAERCGLDQDRQRHLGTQRGRGPRDRHGRAALHDPHLGLLQLAAGGLERDVHGGVVAEELRGLHGGARDGDGLPPGEVGHGADHRERGAAARRTPTPWYGTADARRRS